MTEPRTQCSNCGATCVAIDRCWLCGQPIRPAGKKNDGFVNPYQPPDTAASTTSNATVSVPLIVTVIVVSLGLALAAPGFGIPIAVVVTPALLRTIVQVARNRSAGDDISTPVKWKVFFVSLAGTVTACVAAGVAFFATCAAGCFGLIALDSTAFNMNDYAFAILMISSAAIGLLCGGIVLWLMWRRKASRPIPFPEELRR